jgi:hypothetical protein
MEMPADETGPVPVHYEQATPRFYGVLPGTSVLILAALAVVAAAVLFALGKWPFGLILVGVGVLLALVYAEAERRRPSSAVVASGAEALGGIRARAGFAADSLATRGRAARKLLAARRQLQRLDVARRRLLSELGEAVYRDDEHAAAAATEQLRELDELARQREAEIHAIVSEAQERIRRHRLEVQPTEMVELPDPPEPGETPLPEPYPPPDEGDPPQPAIIPEPGPAVIPEPGPLAPEGEKRRR